MCKLIYLIRSRLRKLDSLLNKLTESVIGIFPLLIDFPQVGEFLGRHFKLRESSFEV